MKNNVISWLNINLADAFMYLLPAQDSHYLGAVNTQNSCSKHK